MDYRDILRTQLKRRQELNPKFSLRSFALKLKISPSKISEVLSGKKKLSMSRLEEIAVLLRLKGVERELFILSAELESTKSKNKEELKTKLKQLSDSLVTLKTTQQNAWYFGAIQTIQDSGLDPVNFKNEMNLTELQIENAVRFLKRIRKNHPDRGEIKYEPISLIKKINESFERFELMVEADFAFLTSDEVDDLKFKMKAMIKKYKADRADQNIQNLRMIFFGFSDIEKKEI